MCGNWKSSGQRFVHQSVKCFCKSGCQSMMLVVYSGFMILVASRLDAWERWVSLRAELWHSWVDLMISPMGCVIFTRHLPDVPRLVYQTFPQAYVKKMWKIWDSSHNTEQDRHKIQWVLAVTEMAWKHKWFEENGMEVSHITTLVLAQHLSLQAVWKNP